MLKISFRKTRNIIIYFIIYIYIFIKIFIFLMLFNSINILIYFLNSPWSKPHFFSLFSKDSISFTASSLSITKNSSIESPKYMIYTFLYYSLININLLSIILKNLIELIYINSFNLFRLIIDNNWLIFQRDENFLFIYS